MNALYKPENFQPHLEEDFFYVLASRMKCPDRPDLAVLALKDTFNIIRNRIAFAESLEFINFLPMPVKALYLDGWRIDEHMPVAFTSMEQLMDDIIGASSDDANCWYHHSREELRNALYAIFQMIGRQVQENNAEARFDFLPQDIQYYLVHHSADTYQTQPDTSIWLS